MTDEQREKKKAQNRASYLRNREKVLARGKARVAANRDLINAQARERHKKNPAKAAEYARTYRAKHPEVIAGVQERFFANHPGYQAEWHKAHREERIAAGKKWHEDNPGKNNSYTTARRLLELRAMPPWVDRGDIDVLYVEAKQKTLDTGIPHEVDHIWPIKGKGFVGLHVPWNLRVITKDENRRKRNHRPDTLTLQTQGG